MNQEQIQPLGAETCPYVVLHGVDTLVINVHYTDERGKPTRALLDEQFIPLLNEWQARAKVEEKPVPIPWTFQNVSFLMHPHGAGKGQWRWLLTSSKLNLALGWASSTASLPRCGAHRTTYGRVRTSPRQW